LIRKERVGKSEEYWSIVVRVVIGHNFALPVPTNGGIILRNEGSVVKA